jgi:hypothetical protein
MCALVRYVRRDIFPKRTSTQRFDEAPKLDGGLGSGTVAVIAIPGAPPWKRQTVQPFKA